MEKKKKNNPISNNSNQNTIYTMFPEKFEKNSESSEIKKLREKFITSEEDDSLSENKIEDQEEQNEIHNLLENPPKEKKQEIKPAKY